MTPLRYVGTYMGIFCVMVGIVFVLRLAVTLPASPLLGLVSAEQEASPLQNQLAPLLHPVAQQTFDNTRVIEDHGQELDELRATIVEQAREMARLRQVMRETQQSTEEHVRHTAALARTVMKQQLRRQSHGQIVERPVPTGLIQ